MKYVFCFLLFTVFPFAAHAEPGDLHFIAHGASYHTVKRTRGPEWNQVNPGIGLRYEWTETVSLQGGVYKNSYYQTSVYGGVDWTPIRVGPVSAGVFGGAASGYGTKAGIAAGGLLRWEGARTSVAFRIVPAKCTIYTIEFGWKF